MNEREIQQVLFDHFLSRSAIMIPNYMPFFWFECDLFQVTKSLYWVEFEVKISFNDFRADFKKTGKHSALKLGESHGPRRFWYVVTEDIAERVQAELPAYAGLIVVCLSKNNNRFVKTIVKAPCLTSIKFKKDNLDDLYRRFYWRFWRQRETVISLEHELKKLKEEGAK